ncbi:hypothetical protein ACIP98_38260 [Streptomyces sp. NPDC088354]|uniref:hypothetical protein n=1 Tax=Streptomyces sp. NPDC088354 TaxID=3365856 RepID=UPI003829603F
MAPDPLAALRRWTELDDGRGQLVLLARGPGGGLREYTPGELATYVADEHEAQLHDLLGEWLARRAAAANRPEDRWPAAAAAWALHWRELNDSLPGPVLDAVVAAAEFPEGNVAARLATDAGRLALIFERLELPRGRAQYIEDWLQLDYLTEDVPVLRATAEVLLDQVALHDHRAQRLRAALEPDVSDHREDVAHAMRTGAAVPVLDEQRTAQLLLARQAVRELTAALHTGRDGFADRVMETFPVPPRLIGASWGAQMWRDASPAAQTAVAQVREQREAVFAQDSDLPREPELMQASRTYLEARGAMLHILHDVLGRLTHLPGPGVLPEQLAEIGTAQASARITQAFGTLDRARQFLAGQIAYLQQEPVPPHRAQWTPGEIERLTAAQDALDQLDPYAAHADTIRRRAQALTRTAPAPPAAAPVAGPATTRPAARASVHPAAPDRAPGVGR